MSELDEAFPSPLDDDLAGHYAVNRVVAGPDQFTTYPPEIASVTVLPSDQERRYYDVHFFDADGQLVAQNNRARYRIEGALEDGDDYDAVVPR